MSLDIEKLSLEELVDVNQRVVRRIQSDLALETIKDPYNFDFLTLAEKAHERDLERGLVDHMREFLLELGMGFAFVGTQVPVMVEGQEL